eukprot:gene1012-1537_t
MVPLDENEPVSVDADFLIAVTEIIFWASVGDLEKLKTFCKNKAFNFKQAYDYDRRSPLHLACVNGCRNVCEWLITEAKVDVNFVDRFGNTPLMGAVLGKHDACIRLLKEKGGKVLEEGFLVSLEDSCVLNTHRTSELPKMDAQYIELIYLASEGILPGLRQSRELLSSGIVKDYDDRTPLHLAAANGKLEAVDYLLSIEVAVNAVDRFGLTPLEGAMRSNLPVRDKVVAALERHDGKVYQHGQLVPSNEADIKAPVVKQTKVLLGSRASCGAVGSLVNGAKEALFGTRSLPYGYRYMAPEVFKHEKYGVKADCYALALIAFQMFEWRAPFDYHVRSLALLLRFLWDPGK